MRVRALAQFCTSGKSAERRREGTNKKIFSSRRVPKTLLPDCANFASQILRPKDTSARVCEFCKMFSDQRRQDCRGTKSTNLVHMWHKLNRFHINRGAMKVFWTRGPWQTIFGKHGTGSCRTDKKRSHSCATTMGTHVRMLQWIFEQQGPGTARYARTRTHRQWGRMHR